MSMGYVTQSDVKDLKFHPETASIQGIVTMLNSRLRSFFHTDVFDNLERCIKWGAVAAGLTISITQAKAEY